MIRNGIEAFAGKRVLLLQGPLGPFFRRLAFDLKQVGATVFKVNFNGGDWLFYPNDAVEFRGKPEEWPPFLAELIDRNSIDTVLLFGDCRPIHRVIHQVLKEKDVRVGVFEEGYVRPDYITFELHGANANSRLPRDAEYYLNQPERSNPAPQKVDHTYRLMAMWAILYYLFSSLLSFRFPHYRHHRPLSLAEAFPWIRSGWRKLYYSFKEKGIQERLISEHEGGYFMMPLQVHNDSQLFDHSRFDTIRDFIEESVASFASHAPDDAMLVIKHHPQDRGYYDYRKLIQRLSAEKSLEGRLIYIHDQHLPTLLDHTKGVVTINSTVGMSALHHKCPLKVCGKAIYDFEGLSFQGALDDFWHEAPTHKPDETLYRKYRSYLINRTQLNGSFYKRLETQRNSAGIVWTKINPDTESKLQRIKPLKAFISSLLAHPRLKLLSNKLFLGTVVVPTLLSVLYFGLIKSDVYISESHFIIRTPQKQMPTGLDAVLQGAGFSGSTEDTQSVHDYMVSRDALNGVQKRLDLRSAFGCKHADLFSCFNPLGFDGSFEALYQYYQKHVEVYQNGSTAISVLKVRTFRPDDAWRINEWLLSMGEGLINQLNERARKDLISHAQAEVALAEKKAQKSAAELAEYRNKNEVFDPVNQSALQLQQVSKLQDEYIAAKTQLAQVLKFTPESPQIPVLQNILATLKAEIDSETGKVAGTNPSLTSKAVEYERLLLEQKFAEKQLSAAMTSLEQARSEAQRQQLYLERIVQPNKPDMAIEPNRFRAILTTFLVGLIAWGILSMLIAGVKEHHD